MSEHSILPPSSAGIWGAPGGCPGWVNWASKFPERPSAEADLGTAAHEMAAQMIEALSTNKTVDIDTFRGLIDTPAPNGVIYDKDMFLGAREYHRAISGIGSPIPAGQRIHGVEQRLEMPQVHPECWGTVDAWIYDMEKNQIHVIDYKYGHLPVRHIYNWQCICYGAGWLNHILSMHPSQESKDRISASVSLHMVIIQPRANHALGTVRDSILSAEEFKSSIGILHDNAAISMGPSAKVVSGKHCMYCPAVHDCPASAMRSMSALEYTYSPQGSGLTPEQIAAEITILRRGKTAILARLSGMEAEATALIESGKFVPGYVIDTPPGRTKWKHQASTIARIAKANGVDITKPVEVLTPRQVGLDKMLPEGTIKSLSHRGRGKPKLQAEDESTVSQIFASGPLTQGQH